MIKTKAYIVKHWQKILDIYFFLNFIGWCAWQSYNAYHEGRFDYLEWSFALQNMVFVTLILIRSPFKAIDKNYFHQFIALFAFFSGAAFMGQARTGNENLELISKGIIFISNILGIITLINIGKSFGILISLRKVKSNGLYGIVRHPMYLTDILLRIGFVICHYNIFTISMLVLSTACYIYRAVLEEKFLSNDISYRNYMSKVKYRFIPLIF